MRRQHHDSPLSSASSSPTESSVSHHIGPPPPAPPPPHPRGSASGYYEGSSSIEAELYHKYATEASAAAAAPRKNGPSWAQRRLPASILALSAVLMALMSALCCTSAGLSTVLFAYVWTVGTGAQAKQVRIGVFARVVEDEAQLVMAGNWGGSASASYLQTWFFCQLFLLLLMAAAALGVAYAPHPPEDAVLRRYRHLIRACIVLLITLTGVPWSLLATLAASQDESQIGYFAVVGQGILVGGSCFGLYLALRFERDEDWLVANEDLVEQKRHAKLRDKQRRAEFKQRKAEAIALAKQRRTRNKIMAEALGREGARALLINQMMSGKGQGAKGNKNFRGGGASQAGFSAQPWSYPPQPPPPAYQPGFGGYGYSSGGGYY